VTDTQQSLKVNKPRCPYCHDDIVGGAENYACHECLTWHHTGCWNEHGGCVSCGNTWMKDPISGVERGTSRRTPASYVDPHTMSLVDELYLLLGDSKPTAGESEEMSEIRKLAGLDGGPSFSELHRRLDEIRDAGRRDSLESRALRERDMVVIKMLFVGVGTLITILSGLLIKVIF